MAAVVRCGAVVVGAVKFSAEKVGIFQTPAIMAAMVANVPLSLSLAVLRLLHRLEAEQRIG